MRSHVTLSPVLICIAFVFAGCDSDNATTPEETPAAPAAESASSTETMDPIANGAGAAPKVAQSKAPGFADPQFEPYVSPGTIKWEGDDAKNATIPEQLPVYANATPVSGSSSKRRFVFEWASNDPKKDVMDFYRDELPKSGYQIELEESYGVFEATRDGEALSVWIGSPPNKPISILVRLEYK